MDNTVLSSVIQQTKMINILNYEYEIGFVENVYVASFIMLAVSESVERVLKFFF